MVDVTAAMVKALRLKTDAPMMECKNILREVGGDMAQAEEILRVRLGLKASQMATRTSAEGLIGLHVASDSKKGAIVEVNCETDFVAKNTEFCQFVNTLAEQVARQSPANDAALLQLSLDEGTVETRRAALVGKIRENITVRRFVRIETPHKLASYVHGGKIGVLVEFSGPDEVGKDLAMHIAATKPKAIDAADVSPEDIEVERAIAQKKADESGKPGPIVAKMVEGAVQKFLKEVTLLTQPFVKNDKQSVGEMLNAMEGSKIYRFVLFVVGEGLEKKKNDFAEEVAAVVQNR